MNIQNSDFAYSATLKLNEMPSCEAQRTWPGVSDMAVNSRSFDTYVECINSAKTFMEEVVKDVNDSPSTIKLTVSAEVNPIHSGIDTRSKDWAADELARLWIFDKAQENSKAIHAIGQARIFALEREGSQALTN